MKATWILPDGKQITAEVKPGRTLMEAAVSNNVPYVIGECGGSMICATCHVVVDPDWTAAAGGPSKFEDGMLDETEAERTATSRLSCQLAMSAALDGIILHVPKP
ncbi:MAG: 2Fe-2S iron-sulfur cluster-binding protein [bacterium]